MKSIRAAFGLAVGDALGAPVEFLSLQAIRERYGENGIDDFDRWDGFAPGSYTDDTQMTLATAVGVIRAYQRWLERGICNTAAVVYRRYLDWLETQDDPRQRRAPGNTCFSALRSGKMGTLEEVINDSKGCGGVMRTAPAGLAYPPGLAFVRGAQYAAITHGHPSGYLPGGFIAELIARIISGENLAASVEGSLAALDEYEGYGETRLKVELACALAQNSDPATDAIARIGEGWVGEEALAIAIYCSLKFPGDWSRAVLAAVNHSGDSDSTGSITGAILGASLGLPAIPQRWVRDLEDTAMINKIAGDMHKIIVLKESLSFMDYPPN